MKLRRKPRHGPGARGRVLRAALLTVAVTGGIGLAAPPRAVAAPAPDAQALPTTPKPYAYGIFVGSNHGGPGQARLRYAEDDARRAAETLRDVGRYGTADMRVLAAPAPDEVLTTLDAVAARLREHAKKGEQAVLLFYYSGHAKATALHLGGKELDLALLRDRLRAIPSTLTLVVLDACQSGAFTRTKGVESAPDFSTNSVARLTTRGTAVIASSSAQELSQESDELHASYFTHHFLVALRGAGDSDRDGRVTLDEAYQYAYRRTLAATERTAVGGQHVTLETDLSGQGEVPLTFPREAKSQLELPAALEGRVLVQHKASASVVAEIQKVAGAPVILALPSGDYEATVRQGGKVASCAATLVDDRVTPLQMSACTTVADLARAKGEGVAESSPAPAPSREAPTDVWPPPRELSNWSAELGFGGTWAVSDAYTRRLESFRYMKNDSGTRLSGALFRNFGRYVALGARVAKLPMIEYRRSEETQTTDDTVKQLGYEVAGTVRLVLPLLPAHARVWFETYAEGSVGVGWSALTIATTSERREDTGAGLAYGGALGIAVGGPFAGGFLNAGFDVARVLDNRLGDTHDIGGPYVLLGARLKTF